ncbi:MAG: fluoride ion transporter CrcB [Proteobacteria bacterium]|nr:fluoride ion transporter CrcB [Pseudomonadota bacterium]
MISEGIAVAGGAALGALSRWGLSTYFNPLFPTVPLGTLLANLVGGYLIGIAVAVFTSHTGLPAELRLFVITGFLGGLTTFSTFSAEVVSLIGGGQFGWALAAVGAHLLGSLLLTILGMVSAGIILRGIGA